MINRDAYIGQQVGNYMLVEKIACGSFGCVYRAEHTRLKNRTVAIKLLNAPLASQEQHESFLQEADLMAMLEHPHILPVLDAGTHNGFPYLITEYCPNGSLRDRLKRQPSRPLPLDGTLTILEQIADALQFAHEQNIIHRDLKPENILFNAKGSILLADFGIAKMLDTVGIRQGTAIGTPAYMAPEQFRGLTSRESDQYALGCIAYELFTGRQPFVAPDMASLMFKHLMEQPVALREQNAQVPTHIEQAILKALAKEREERHADVISFSKALQETAKQWLDEGHDLLWKAKRYEEALIAYNQAIRLDPNNADAYIKKGVALYNLKRYEEALGAYEQAIRLDPGDAYAYKNKSIALDVLERYEEALRACEQAIRLDPGDAYAYGAKGNALSGLNRYEEAFVAYEQALRLNPNEAIIYTNKGMVLNELKRYKEALGAYEQALRLNPNYDSAYNNKGVALAGLKRYEEALGAYEQAIRLNPNYAYAYNNKGDVLKKLGRTQEAQQVYEKARQLGYKG